MCFAQKIPQKAEHLANALLRHFEKAHRNIGEEQKAALKSFNSAEEAFFTQKDHPLFSWNENIVLQTAEKLGFAASGFSRSIDSKRLITQDDVALWFSEKSEYGRFLKQHLEEPLYKAVQELAETAAARRIPLEWQQYVCFFKLSKRFS